MPAGRPKSEVETEVVAIRISKDLGARLNRYVDLVTSRGQGAKASKNSVVGFALAYFLDAKDKERASTHSVSPQVKPATSQESVNLRQKLQAMSSMRRKIIDLLAEHPVGLSPIDVRTRLSVSKDLRSTMKNMEKEGLLKRIRTGYYGVAPEILEILETTEG